MAAMYSQYRIVSSDIPPRGIEGHRALKIFEPTMFIGFFHPTETYILFMQ